MTCALFWILPCLSNSALMWNYRTASDSLLVLVPCFLEHIWGTPRSFCTRLNVSCSYREACSCFSRSKSWSPVVCGTATHLCLFVLALENWSWSSLVFYEGSSLVFRTFLAFYFSRRLYKLYFSAGLMGVSH